MKVCVEQGFAVQAPGPQAQGRGVASPRLQPAPAPALLGLHTSGLASGGTQSCLWDVSILAGVWGDLASA